MYFDNFSFVLIVAFFTSYLKNGFFVTANIDDKYMTFGPIGEPPQLKRLSDDSNNVLQKTCGIAQQKSPMTEERIAGGKKALRGQFPWAVSLASPGGGNKCTAVLISEWHVLTAIHCFYNYVNHSVPCVDPKFDPNSIAKSNILIHYGGVCIRVDSSAGCELQDTQTVGMKKVLLGKEFTDSRCTSGNDVAIVELERKVNLGGDVQAICLLNVNLTAESHALKVKNFIDMGWGRDEKDHSSAKLRFLKATPLGVSGNMLVSTGWREGDKSGTRRGICLGDSGGPTQATGPGDKAYLMGIHSHGPPCTEPANGYGTYFSTFIPLMLDDICALTGEPPQLKRLSDDSNTVLQKTCGIAQQKSPMTEERIIGGKKALRGQFPWAVSLASPGGGNKCTAVLISEWHVLTAIHCFYNYANHSVPCVGPSFDPKSINKNEYVIHYGGVCTRVDSSAGCELQDTQTVGMKKVLVGKEFTKSLCQSGNDVAIVELERKINLGGDVQAICLLDVSRHDIDLAGSHASKVKNFIDMGWGRYEEDHSSAKLRFLKATPLGVTGNMLLSTGLKKGDNSGTRRGICNGDSGGPTQATGLDERAYLMGIHSSGPPCNEPAPNEDGRYYSTFIPPMLDDICALTGVCPPRDEVTSMTLSLNFVVEALEFPFRYSVQKQIFAVGPSRY
ncbi:trypsin domain-containing protein [Ditylenchus destructor]|nr:trypsin domain-containing protein [Ditylenchus destructor]